ncbi:hypothetical protein GNF80_02655 [Clostridium perfringens]|nr:hypothetical protein [Clostridium perfringens]
MKKGKILFVVLAGLITTGLLVGSFMGQKNTSEYGGELYILSNNAVDDSENNKIKVIKEHDFKLEEGIYDYESLVMRDGKLYLESRESGNILKTEEIIFEGENSKRVEVEKLKEFPNLRDIEFILSNCEFEDLGNGKWRVFSKDYGKEVVVNIEKFNKDKFAENTLKESEDYYFLENYLLFLMDRKFYLGEGNWDEDGQYKEIRWYDFNNEVWDSIEVPKEVCLSSSLIGIVDSKVFMQGYENNMQQFPSKIYSLDLKQKVLKDEVDLLEEGGEAYYDLAFLNKEKILFHSSSRDGEKIKMLDLRNKVATDLCNYEIDGERFFLSQKVSPSGDKLFYLSKNGENLEVKVLKIGNNKVIAEGNVYEYKYDKAALINEYGEDYIDPTPHILWSNDGKYLIIGEKENGSLKISNIKILELSQ